MLPSPKYHYGATLQPPIPETWQECFYTTLYTPTWVHEQFPAGPRLPDGVSGGHVHLNARRQFLGEGGAPARRVPDKGFTVNAAVFLFANFLRLSA